MAKKVQVTAYLCEKCGKQYPTEYLADICCKQYYCENCGQPTEQYHLLCKECSEKRKFDRAKKMSYSDYIKQFPDNMIWDGEDYYSELEEMADLYVCGNLSAPDYVWGTEQYRVEIDIDSAIECAEVDANLEDFSFDTYGETDSLRKFVKQWNEKNGVNAYYGDYSIAIVLTDKEKEWFKGESS